MNESIVTPEEKAAIREILSQCPDSFGTKYDSGKLDWHSFPLACLEGLIKVSMAGCLKYDRFNCLKPFVNGDQRLFSSAMRHTVACQMDPLAVDEESGLFHGYQAAWSMIMRTWHAEQAAKND